MALVKCKECGAQISDMAKACPQCGAAPKPSTSRTTIAVGGLFILAVAGMVSNANKSDVNYQTTASQAAAPTGTNAATPPLDPAKQKADREINVVLLHARALKQSMKKPETFELLTATLMEKAICYEYRARNSFNDRTNEHYVVVDLKGSSSAKDWNTHCAGKTGTDYTAVRSVL